MHYPPATPLVRRQSAAWLLILIALPAVCRAQSGGSGADSTAAPTVRPDTTQAHALDTIAPPTRDTTAAVIPATRVDTSLAQAPDSASAATLDGLGFDNITLDPAGHVAVYENRRYRQSAEARGLAARRLRPSRESPVSFYERRLGMAAATVVDTGDAVPRSVAYPSDRGWIAPSWRPVLRPTWRTVDIDLIPLFTYEIGRILDPVLVRIEIEPRLRYNPWPGAQATASLIIPLRNDFTVDELHPDIDQVRPGPVTLEQFGWIKHVALVSGTAGIFANNRYGFSMGAAVPLMGGAFLADGEADLTGYLAFPAPGPEYSTPELWTGWAGLTYRPPFCDLALRGRVGHYLYDDNGGEVELRRSLGDLDVAFFFQRAGGISVHGLRLDVPLPPMKRPTGHAVRVLPAARFPLTYRDEAAPVGRSVSGVASREEFLRQLSAPSLAANANRYRGEPPARRSASDFGNDRVSLTGMTGFINTPWCGVIQDRRVEAGYNQIPKKAAYDHRDEYRNDVYYAALGFLPHVEAGLRWTVLPGSRAFSDVAPDSKLTDSDRMLSGRISLLTPRLGRPGLAVGIEDAFGTRRFHSTYAVAGIPFEYQGLHSRLTLGYAPRVLTASRYTLDGAFGATEVNVWRPVALSLEYDTEKWNTALGLELPLGLRARVALLDMQHLSFGAGWSVGL